MSTEHTQRQNESSNQTSHSLIGMLKSDEPAAWDRLVDLYSPLIYYWCQKSGLPKQEIPDVFQEVFQAVARGIQKFQHQKDGTFRGWLRTLTRNKAIDHFRKYAKEPQPVGGTEARHKFASIPSLEPMVANTAFDPESFNEPTPTSIRRELLQRALSNIRPHFQEQTWQAFWLVAIDGRETQDVAQELAMQPGTIRVAKSRVLKRLRQEFGDSED